MEFRRGGSRMLGRALMVTVTLALGAGGPARPATAWEYPLLPHVNALAFFPETPTTDLRVSAQLSAYYPNECWRLVDTLRVDSTEVRVTIARATDCPAESLSYWSHAFDLGYFSAGIHELTVHCTVLQDGQPPLEEEITVPFEVVEGTPPPPPPPGGVLPLVEIIEVTGPEPEHPVTLTLRGFKPFECTVIHGERVIDQAHVEAYFDRAESCADTSRRWSRSFDMGVYPIGNHEVGIRLELRDGDSVWTENHFALVQVRDPNAPPPLDSVTILVTSMTTEPAEPTVSDEVTLRVEGRYPPAFCGEFVQDGRWDHTLELVMRPVRACDDTARAWEHVFHLGQLAAGDHPFQLTTIWQLYGTAAYRYWPDTIRVRDPDGPPPPPPPPPVDTVYTLSPSKPNPFRDATQFSVTLEDAQPAEVVVFDLAGRRVSTIHRGMLPRGTSWLAWNGRRQDGTRAASGIYFYQLSLVNRVVHRRVVLLDAP